MLKRIVAIMLALLMLAPVAYAAPEGMVYRLSGGNGEIGDTVKVVVSVENAPGIISYESVLLYDPAILKPVGKHQKMNMGGMMVFNSSFATPVEGKGAIKVAAAGLSSKSIIEGDMDLFNFSFEIIGGSTNENGTLVEVHTHSFSQNDEALSKVSSITVAPCYIGVPLIREEAPDTTPDEQPSEDPKEEAPAEDPKEENPSTDGAASDAEESKKPTGDWYFADDQAVLVEKDEDGQEVFHQFTVEEEKDKDGNITGLILYDKEDKEAGKLKVEVDEYGNIDVIEQDLGGKSGFSLWFLLPIGAAVLIAIGGILLAIKNKKK